MIILAYGNTENLEHSDETLGFADYTSAAVYAQKCRFPDYSTSFYRISNLNPASSQWRMITPDEKARIPQITAKSVILSNIDRWQTSNDWRGNARHEEALIQVCDDFKSARIDVLLTMSVAKLGRKLSLLRRGVDVTYHVVQPITIKEIFTHGYFQS